MFFRQCCRVRGGIAGLMNKLFGAATDSGKIVAAVLFF